MNRAKVGVLMIVIGISVGFLMGLVDELFYKITYIKAIDRQYFDFLPYPVVKNDGISVELIHAKDLKMDNSGEIILNSDQVENFKKLDPINAKIVNLGDWPNYSLEIRAHDNDNKKEIQIYLPQGRNRIYTSYDFENDKLKLKTVRMEDAVLSREISGGCLISFFIIFGLILIMLDIIKIIRPPKKEYSFIEPPPDIYY